MINTMILKRLRTNIVIFFITHRILMKQGLNQRLVSILGAKTKTNQSKPKLSFISQFLKCLKVASMPTNSSFIAEELLKISPHDMTFALLNAV